MVVTPWGGARELRGRRLPPGRGQSREAVARNQRERLFAAMVAACAEKGYENTSVADLLEISGVSRNAFYEHFRDREDCFVAAAERMLEDVLTMARHLIEGEGGGEERARAALEAVFALIAMQRRPQRGSACSSPTSPAARRPRDGAAEAGAAPVEVGDELPPPPEPLRPKGRRRSGTVQINGLLTDRMRSAGPAGLPQIAPFITYVSLTPFVGAEEACRIANGDGRRR